MLVSTDSSSASKLLNAIGTLTSGIGAILTAAAAISGVATWKKQITYGKYIDLIWKAQVACQNVSLNGMAYYVASATPRPTAEHVLQAYERTRSTAPTSRANTERFLVDLVHACQHLDKLVTKTELNWTVRANRLRHSFITMANDFDANNPDHNSQNRKYYSEVFDSVKSLENDLDELESQYK